jgi:hypothetical protein
LPCVLARWKPARTRSRRRSRSKSAIAPRMCICSLPAGVVESMPSAKLTNATPSGLQVLEQRDQVPQIASEAIQPPADHDVEPAASGVLREVIQRGPAILRAADSPVHVLVPRPAAGLQVAAELLQLVLRLLVDARDPRIDGGFHARASV